MNAMFTEKIKKAKNNRFTHICDNKNFFLFKLSSLYGFLFCLEKRGAFYVHYRSHNLTNRFCKGKNLYNFNRLRKLYPQTTVNVK